MLIMRLSGKLEDRGTWVTHGVCPIEKAMGVVGSRNAMLIMREAFYGTTRFEDFGHRVGMSDATTSANLKALVEAGLLARSSYKEAGHRTRPEYVLTEAGRDLMPVVVGLFNWGMKHAAAPPPLAIDHDGCGQQVDVRLVCEAGHDVAPDNLELRVAR
jgi:DNA-binding HxlR family transcriptional regulator